MKQIAQKALLLENIHEEAVRRFESAGFEVIQVSKSLSEDELTQAIEHVGVLGIRSKTQVTEQVLRKAKDLWAIGCFCIGTDQVNLNVAAETGIAVFNAPFSNTRSVVELAVGEMISLLRRLPEKSAQLHDGVWNKSAVGAHEVRGQVLGIIGYGNIGKQLSVLAEAMGLTVLFYDIEDKLSLGNAVRCDTVESLLERSDIVSLHIDGRPENRLFFGEKYFSKMKEGSLFLNLCRGIVIDHDALASHLKSGHIAGAAVDVFLSEPSGKSTEFSSPLQGIPNVILTPHIGGSTEEAQADIGAFVSAKLLDFVKTGATGLSVNFPNLTPTPDEGKHHRLVHLHQNVPGVLAKINSILADRGVNVDAQFLSTRGQYGYVLTDVSVDYDVEVLDRLRELDATVRLRVVS